MIYYARAAGGNWTAAATWSLTSGGGATGSTPTAADEVIFDANSGAVTINTGAVARSMTINGYTNTLTHSAITLTLGDATAGTGNVIINIVTTGWTYTLANIATSAINLVSSAGTAQTIKTNGKVLGNLNMQGGATYTLADALTATGGTITLTQGTFDTANFAINALALNYGNATARTLTFGSSAITLTSAANAFTGTAATNLTVTANTAIMTLTGAAVSTNNVFLLNNKDWNGLSIVVTGGGQGAFSIGGTSARLKDFTITGTAAQGVSYRLASNFTITGAFTFTGNSAINRPLLYGLTLGTPNVFSAATTVISNADFMDITGAGAATWAITSGLVGDWGGNSVITVTTPATQTRDSTNGAAWGVAARWTSRVPLPQDDVIINGSSGNISATDVLILGKSIDFTGYTGTLTHTSNGLVYSIFGSLTLSTGMSFGSAVNTFSLDFAGRGTYVLTSNGKTIFPVSSNQAITVRAPGGSYSLADTFSQITGGVAVSFNVTVGGFDSTSKVINTGRFLSTGTLTRSVTLGTTVINASATGAISVLSLATTGLTWSGASATVVVVNASGSARTLDLQTQTLGTFQYNVANSTGGISVLSSGTVLNFNIGTGRIITLTANIVLTIPNQTLTGSPFGYLYFMSLAGAYVSVPDSAATSWNTDFDYRFKLAPDAWGQTNMNVAGKQTTGSTGYAWAVTFNASSKQPALGVSTNGTTVVTATSTAAVPFADGADGWLRVTWRKSDGRVQFFTSTSSSNDPSVPTWTQLGSDRTANTGGVFDSPASAVIGAVNVSNAPVFTGKFYRAQFRNNILDDGTGIQLDVDFTTKAFGADTFTESSSNAATATVNGTLVAGDGRIQIVSATGGTPAYISKPYTDPLLTDYNVIKDIRMQQPLNWWAGSHSVDNTGNGNIVFSATPGTFRHRQSSINSLTNTAITGTLAVTPVAGNVLVAHVTSVGSSGGGIVDPPGWTLFKQTGASPVITTYVKKSDGTETTVPYSQNTNRVLIIELIEYSGFTGNPVLDVSDSNTGVGATISTSAGTPPNNTEQPELALVLLGSTATMSAIVSATNSFGLDFFAGSITSSMHAAAKELTSIGSVETTLVWTTSRTVAAHLIVIKDVSSFKPQTVFMG